MPGLCPHQPLPLTLAPAYRMLTAARALLPDAASLATPPAANCLPETRPRARRESCLQDQCSHVPAAPSTPAVASLLPTAPVSCRGNVSADNKWGLCQEPLQPPESC
ncbi:dual specificity mitogen-activated protein kinase kinase 7 [Platysternon megacephalum]|uniref:Dual specificity mitogen-activated protein kinase kinase 7 n=1 Tax=Platysternon megacephalum TaxID=55544 RepID=A0A4D9DNU8_9SAUR|nr:dual specificity mitogen-activated protein kinase kinase 7 [Platysternon megacephalum]